MTTENAELYETIVVPRKRKDGQVAEPEMVRSCNGNACASLTVTAIYRPGELTILAFRVANAGAKPARVKIRLADMLGGCGLEVTDTVPANGSKDISTEPGRYTMGYCKMSADFV